MKIHCQGENNPFYGKTHSEELKERMRTNNPMQNEEIVDKMAETRRGLNLHWYNNGVENVMTSQCPEGFVEGMIYPKNVKHPKAKGRKAWNKGVSGLHWYTNGVKSVQAHSCPDGFYPGRAKIKINEK